jgi:predicted ester cyclase
MSSATELASIKTRIFQGLASLATDGVGAATDLFADDVHWHGPAPIDDLRSRDALVGTVLAPLYAAIPDLERRDDILLAGRWEDASWVVSAGHYAGTFAADWLGIPATGGLVFLRFGEYYRVEAGRIVEARVIWDMIDFMRQAGVNPLPQAAGVEIVVPGPRTRDGVRPGVVDLEGGERTHAAVLAMFAGLGAYDGKTLESMGMERFWSPNMLWYGPGGIGSNRGVKGFQDFHQRPFLTAFPDRRGAGHKCRIADGAYVASTGWPSVLATHAGPYLGHPATGRRIGMRVMDLWRAEGTMLAENWVLIDLIDLFRQFGVDLMARARDLAAARR